METTLLVAAMFAVFFMGLITGVIVGAAIYK
jgi:MFS superfamily sulfate permease-like transporter